jgi:16S rRNA (adenine1518-N6/adenine1519-N6)-dimethyltransferase
MGSYRTKKRLGQHILVDRNVIDKIVNLAATDDSKHIVEIGPGRGAISRPLVESGVKLTAIEFDRDLIGYLSKLLRDFDAEIINQDVLNCDLSEIVDSPVALVGNLPYNISTPIVEWVVSNRTLVSRAVFMVQKEVADRLSASCNSKDWSPLAIMTQLYFDVTLEFIVEPESFSPPPRVRSAVVSLTPTQASEIDDIESFEKVVRASFVQRRKLLSKNLSEAFGVGGEEVGDVLQSLGFDDNIRAEQLSIEQFAQLTGALNERGMVSEKRR